MHGVAGRASRRRREQMQGATARVYPHRRVVGKANILGEHCAEFAAPLLCCARHVVDNLVATCRCSVNTQQLRASIRGLLRGCISCARVAGPGEAKL